ncbi:energy transducer TonB [Ferruginibacter sp. SUN106]|uniref:energy transducer TonB n=1 Tax=Ferruginibacter sp. SUN106 TaxID=2978348 RepID=UPI003D36102A
MKLFNLTFFSAIIFCSSVTTVNAQGDTLQKFPNGNLLLKNKPGFRLQTAAGTVLCSWDGVYNSIYGSKNVLQIVKQRQGSKDKFGIVDLKEGVVILPVLYDGIGKNNRNINSHIMVVRQDKLIGLFSVANNAATPLQFTNVADAPAGNLVLFKDSSAYLYDKLLQFKDSIKGMYWHKGFTSYTGSEYLNTYLIARLKNGEGLLDERNHLIFKKGWLEIIQLKGAYLLVKTKDGIGVYNIKTGKQEEPYTYDACIADGGALFFLQKKQQWKMMDTLGNKLARFEASSFIHSTSWEAFFFKQGERWGMMNRNGKIIQTPLWASIDRFEDYNFFRATLPNGKIKYYDYEFTGKRESRMLTGFAEGNHEEDQGKPQIMLQEGSVNVAPVEEFRAAVVEMPHPENDTTIFIRMEIDPTCRQGSKMDSTVIQEKILAAKKEKHITAHGTVTIRVVIEKDGKMSRTEILETDNEKLNTPSIEIVQQLNNWQPGIQNGRNIRGYKKIVLRW